MKKDNALLMAGIVFVATIAFFQLMHKNSVSAYGINGSPLAHPIQSGLDAIQRQRDLWAYPQPD